MIEALGLAVLVVSGVDLWRVGVLGAALHFPVLVLLLAGVIAWKARVETAGRSALFCEGVASEMRSGAPMRQALIAAAESVGVALPTAPGLEPIPISELGDRLAGEFPDIARELALVVRFTGRSGARSSDLFDEIGSLAIAKEEIAREVQVASSPARATAAVFLVAPLVYLLWRAWQGGLSELVSSGDQRIAATAGLALFLTGLGVAGRIMWKAR